MKRNTGDNFIFYLTFQYSGLATLPADFAVLQDESMMKKTKLTLEEFIETTKPMIGLSLNHAWRGYGSAIFLEIGILKKEKGRNNPQGEFSVMLDCSWRMEKPRSILVGSFATHARIEKYLGKLVGSRVKEVGLFGTLPEIMISFDSKVKVLSFETYDTQPSWSMQLPDGRWVSSRNGALIQELAEPVATADRAPVARSG